MSRLIEIEKDYWLNPDYIVTAEKRVKVVAYGKPTHWLLKFSDGDLMEVSQAVFDKLFETLPSNNGLGGDKAPMSSGGSKTNGR